MKGDSAQLVPYTRQIDFYFVFIRTYPSQPTSSIPYSRSTPENPKQDYDPDQKTPFQIFLKNCVLNSQHNTTENISIPVIYQQTNQQTLPCCLRQWIFKMYTTTPNLNTIRQPEVGMHYVNNNKESEVTLERYTWYEIQMNFLTYYHSIT